MLTRSRDIAPQGEFYADSLLTQPTLSHSVFDNLAAGFATPLVAANMLDDQFSKQPLGQAMLSSLNQVKLEQETPGMGWTQWLAGEGANMIGMGLNPLTWALGEGGGALLSKALPSVAAKALPDAATVFMRRPINEMLSQPLGKYIPSMVGKEGAEQPLSLGLMSEKSLSAFGTFAGAGVPQGVVDNYNQSTGNIAWGGVAREMGEMGAFGIAIGSIPFGYGVLRGKINRAMGEEPTADVTNDTLNKALADGHITEAEHGWYADYMAYQKDPKNTALGEDLKSRASQIINNNGHTANTATNEAMFEMLTPNDISNLQGAISDQVSGGVPEEYKTALSDFIIHNRMDNIREKPDMLDGVRGYVDSINQKLQFKDEKLQEADRIVDKYLSKGLVKYYHGYTPREGVKYSEEIQFPDHEFGKGYWMSPHKKEVAEQYGSTIEKVEGSYKIFDVNKPDDKELDNLYKNVRKTSQVFFKDEERNQPLRSNDIQPTDKQYKEARDAVNKFREAAQEKGYEGFERLEDESGLPEIMFFKKPFQDKNMPLSQKELSKKMDKAGFDSNNMKQLPVTIPDNLLRRAKMQSKIDNLNKKIKASGDNKDSLNQEINKRRALLVSEIEQNLPKILTPKEELDHLRESLLGSGLPKNFERSNAYHRLVDLSNVWHNARTLLDRVHLEHEYNRQEAFRDLSNQILKIADSNTGKISKPDDVLDYMKRRVEGQLTKIEPIKVIEKAVSDKNKVPADSDEVLNEQKQQLQNSKAEEAKDEFNAASDKFREFKESSNIFKNLVSCVLGGMNV